MNHLEKLIIDLKESLERQILAVEGSLRQEMRDGFARIENRFDTQAARLDHQAALIQNELRRSLEKWEKRNGGSDPGTQPAN